MENREFNNTNSAFPNSGGDSPVKPASIELPGHNAARIPAWVYLIFVLLVIVGGYCIYLQKQIVTFDRNEKKLQKDASALNDDLRFQTNAYELEKKQMLQEIEILKGKISNAEKSVNVNLDKASRDAINKLEEERDYWRGEIENVISYYQKQFHTPKTPPPSKTIRK